PFRNDFRHLDDRGVLHLVRRRPRRRDEVPPCVRALQNLESLHGSCVAIPPRQRLRHIPLMTSSVISRAHHMAEAGDQVPALYMLTVLALAAIVFSIHLISVTRSRRRAPRQPGRASTPRRERRNNLEGTARTV